MLRIGALGAAAITPGALLEPARDNPDVEVSAIAARDPARARAFAERHAIPRALPDYQAIIDDPEIDAVYIALPISHHHRWTIQALAAGKHVLCEKSFASNAVEAEEMARAADAAGRICMDAFHYRYHPLFLRAREIVASGVLGELTRLHAQFTIPVPAGRDNIRLDYHTGGGVTMDIGCYPLSWIRHLSGEEPRVVSASAVVGPPEVDLRLEAALVLPSGASASALGDMTPDCAFSALLTADGSNGALEVINPLVPQRGHELKLTVAGHTTTETFERRPTYAYQLDAFARAVRTGEPPLTDAWDATRQMRLIDAVYRAAGLRVRGN